MRRLLLSMAMWVAACLLVRSAPPAGKGTGTAMPQIPFGQTYKDFQFPIWQKGQLAYTLTADSATGVTLNRADASNVKIDVYTDEKVTTTITSPRADLYVSDRKMRSKNTVKIVRADMDATSQVCDFDLLNKKYLLRQNVHVLLKNFDVGGASPNKGAPGAKPPATSPTNVTRPLLPEPAPPPVEPAPAPNRNGESLLDFPGATATTNSDPSPSGSKGGNP